MGARATDLALRFTTLARSRTSKPPLRASRGPSNLGRT